MRILRIIMIIVFAAVLPQQTFAQNILEHLVSKEAGQGTVNIMQEQRLTNLVNGKGSGSASAQDRNSSSTAVGNGDWQQDTNPATTGKKVKVRGFRVQLYWGGSQRTDQAKAQQIGAKVSAAFPELGTYTSFESPHWRCRVGDFVKRQDAADCLQKLRQAGLGNDAMIVRSEVYVYQ